MKIGYSWARFRNIGMTIWVRLKVRYDAMFQNNIIFCGEEYIYVFFHYQIGGLFYVQTNIVKPNGFTRTMTKYWCDVHIYGIFCNVNCTKTNLKNLAVFPWCPLTHSGRLPLIFQNFDQTFNLLFDSMFRHVSTVASLTTLLEGCSKVN